MKVSGELVWPAQLGKVTVRYRSALPTAERRIKLIAPDKPKAAIAAIVGGSFGIDVDGVAPAVARFFGFARTSEDIASVITAHVKAMVRKSELAMQNGHLTLPNHSGCRAQCEPI